MGQASSIPSREVERTRPATATRRALAGACLLLAIVVAANDVTSAQAVVARSRSEDEPSLVDRAGGALRIVTWNVDDDEIFAATVPEWASDTRPARFARVVRSVRPDVVCLQEVTRSAAVAVSLMTRLLPADRGGAWHGYAFGSNIIVSRYPLEARAGDMVTLGSLQRSHATALVRLPARVAPHDLYLICAHMQSGAGPEQVALRQRQADVIAAWIRDARTAGGRITLKPRTPIVVAGDFNVIDNPSPSLSTLMTGVSATATTATSPVPPDWSGSALRDVMPHQNDTDAETYTWRDDTQAFPSGALDRILYTASVVTVSRSFVLNTTTMSGEQLRRNGLRAGDVMRDPVRGVHDHLPVVADLLLSPR